MGKKEGQRASASATEHAQLPFAVELDGQLFRLLHRERGEALSQREKKKPHKNKPRSFRLEKRLGGVRKHGEVSFNAFTWI
ncbi:Transmembrane protein 106B [Podarcis lilfordi]|uniref:Transmembrane protein 106B n=1 Tax=Podarcis lilfordi TaxID=74358 RepID=A0AA35L3S3_9SAUR|nr:Transmembrane protein 106B [Podarcis lilfordi]